MITLTEKQKIIADLLVSEGLSDKEIALRLGVCIATVKMHLQRIRKNVEEETGIENPSRLKIALYLLGIIK